MFAKSAKLCTEQIFSTGYSHCFKGVFMRFLVLIQSSFSLPDDDSNIQAKCRCCGDLRFDSEPWYTILII